MSKPAPLDLSQLQVLVPYPTLVELLKAPSEVVELRAQVGRIELQQAALRKSFTDLLELYNSYQD